MVIWSDTYFVSVTTITHSKTSCFAFKDAVFCLCKSYLCDSKTTCFVLWDYISSTPKTNPLHLQRLPPKSMSNRLYSIISYLEQGGRKSSNEIILIKVQLLIKK